MERDSSQGAVGYPADWYARTSVDVVVVVVVVVAGNAGHFGTTV
jgi:hypothetical protein